MNSAGGKGQASLAVKMQLIANLKQSDLENQRKQKALIEYQHVTKTIERYAINGCYDVRIQVCFTETVDRLREEGFKVECGGIIMCKISWK